MIYFGVGAVWIVFADLLLGYIPPHSFAINRLAFICVTGATLYFVASRYTYRLNLSMRAEQESGARARAYFESAAEGIVQLDSDGLIRQMNRRALAIFGYTESEILGQPVEILVPPRLRERHLTHRASFFSAPRSRRMGAGMDIIGARKDGSEFAAEVSLSHIVHDEADHVIAFVSDVTARRVMEREARRNETLHALGAVAAGIAHELNNPLAVVATRVELMLSSAGELPAETREDLQVVHRNVERASRISHNLLALARQRPSARAPVDVNGSIEEIVTLVFGEARTSGLMIDLKLDHSIARVNGDQVGLEQVIVNLLMNARDASADRIRIETRTDSDRAGWIQVIVTDNGVGVAPEVLARVFDPFYTTKEQGTGLGLWLSDRVIHDHGGTIQAESKPGQGTSFVIRLPGIEREEAAASAVG